MVKKTLNPWLIAILVLVVVDVVISFAIFAGNSGVNLGPRGSYGGEWSGTAGYSGGGWSEGDLGDLHDCVGVVPEGEVISPGSADNCFACSQQVGYEQNLGQIVCRWEPLDCMDYCQDICYQAQLTLDERSMQDINDCDDLKSWVLAGGHMSGVYAELSESVTCPEECEADLE